MTITSLVFEVPLEDDRLIKLAFLGPVRDGTGEIPAACFSLFLRSYVQPCNRLQSVIEDDDDEDDYNDEED